MGGKGGQADDSGMYEALASAQAADQAYALGEQQLQWTQQVWNQEQPTVQAVEAGDVQAQGIANQFAGEQANLYEGTYAPLQQEYANQAQQWASPAQQDINAAAASANVTEQSNAALGTSEEQLESYGINPGSTRFGGLDIGARTAAAASAAGAGTQEIQATKLQGMGLEANAVAQGEGEAGSAAGLASAGTGAGTGASTAAQSNLATGSSAMTAPANWYNTGAANMNTYVNAVNGYNQAQLGYAQVGEAQSAGLGSLAGGLLGILAAGGPTDPSTMKGIPMPGGPGQGIPAPPPRGQGNVTTTPGVTAQSPSTIPPDGTPGGAVPVHASASGGQAVDDVPARLTVGEFVVPKDVVDWEGQKYFYNQIDKSRGAAQQAKQRGDIGGQQGFAAPAQPTFTSRPPAGQPPQRGGIPMPQQRAA